MKVSFLCCAFYFVSFALYSLTGFCVVPSQIQDTKDPTLVLLAPTAGATWYADHTYDILWSASDTNLRADGIDLLYSLDSGTSYLALGSAIANSGTFPLGIPHFQISEGRIRVIARDTFGNFTERTNPLTIAFVPPRQVQDLQLSMVNGTDALLSWQEVTQSVLGEAMTPDGYMLFGSTDPFASDEDFILLDTTTQTSHTILNTSLEYDRYFFRILAYKNYRGKLESIMKEVRQGYNLARIKQMLQSEYKDGGK